jgi:hypothetical protein
LSSLLGSLVPEGLSDGGNPHKRSAEAWHSRFIGRLSNVVVCRGACSKHSLLASGGHHETKATGCGGYHRWCSERSRDGHGHWIGKRRSDTPAGSEQQPRRAGRRPPRGTDRWRPPRSTRGWRSPWRAAARRLPWPRRAQWWPMARGSAARLLPRRPVGRRTRPLGAGCGTAAGLGQAAASAWGPVGGWPD